MHSESEDKHRFRQGWSPLSSPRMLSDRLATLAQRALIHEAASSPKPGLVTSIDRGAHHDMDFGSFVASALALGPFFKQAATIGTKLHREPPEECLEVLRSAGREAESSMEEATGGVNAHRGAIFSMGLAVAAVSRTVSLGEIPHGEAVAKAAGSFVAGIVERELTPLLLRHEEPLSAGERLFVSMGVDGIRGEAERGFPSALVALSRLKSYPDPLSSSAMCDALLSVLASGNDTNVLSRGGKERMIYLAEAAEEALRLGCMKTSEGRRKVAAMERYCLDNWVSPGGSADMLALAVFLVLVEREWPASSTSYPCTP